MSISKSDLQKEYYILNRDKKLQYQKEYRQKNIAIEKANYILNRDKKLQYQKEYRQKNIEAYKDYQKAYFLNHKDDILAKQQFERKVDKILYPKEKKAKKSYKKNKKKLGSSDFSQKEDTPNYFVQNNSKTPKETPKETPKPFVDFRITPKGFILDF
jgi:hypothetical protein